MKKSGILNDNLSKLIAEMGHTDQLVIADAGLPIPANSNRIDLALKKGIPSFIDVLKAVLEELVIEKVILASEIKEASPELYKEILDIVDGVSVEYCSHQEFKERTNNARGIVRSGETTPYANIILVSGVDF